MVKTESKYLVSATYYSRRQPTARERTPPFSGQAARIHHPLHTPPRFRHVYIRQGRPTHTRLSAGKLEVFDAFRRSPAGSRCLVGDSPGV